MDLEKWCEQKGGRYSVRPAFTFPKAPRVELMEKCTIEKGGKKITVFKDPSGTYVTVEKLAPYDHVPITERCSVEPDYATEELYVSCSEEIDSISQLDTTVKELEQELETAYKKIEESYK